jgi:hypothetical protein
MDCPKSSGVSAQRAECSGCKLEVYATDYRIDLIANRSEVTSGFEASRKPTFIAGLSLKKYAVFTGCFPGGAFQSLRRTRFARQALRKLWDVPPRYRNPVNSFSILS